jgi:tRNA-specific 2-thiouridylase
MKIAVGMSGGVDSSVAALLLQQQGHEVVGVFMKNWEDAVEDPSYRVPTSGCSWEQDYADMRAVCDQLGIEYTTFNFVEEYKERVFGYFLDELKAGRTPNPDIMCNQEIKFHLFMKRALQLPGIEAIATGHYARIADGKLSKPADQDKDQTYFLHRIDPQQLERVRFPLSELTKTQVREIAQKEGLTTAEKKDSTGICFIGDIDYDTFIDQYMEKAPGDIVTQEGEVIGQHEGLHFYTIGQRRGINIGGTGPYYVVQKNGDTNQLVVTNDAQDPDLSASECTITDMHWLTNVTLPIECKVMVRYRQAPVAATAQKNESGNISLTFARPIRAVTPGQSAVLYEGDIVLGGGIITA